MKVLKVVGEGAERRTYVDDGPKCDENIPLNSKGGWYCRDGKSLYYPPGFTGPSTCKACPACHGTGVIPVELWPDAVKAEWLCGLGYDGFDYYSGPEEKMTARVTWYLDVAQTDAQYIEGRGNNLTEALTALVIAVAEEEK